MKTIGKASIEFWQDGNTLGSTEEVEALEIRAEYQMPEPGKGEECFFVLKTEGWSTDDVGEIGKLTTSFQKHLQEISEE